METRDFLEQIPILHESPWNVPTKAHGLVLLIAKCGSYAKNDVMAGLVYGKSPDSKLLYMSMYGLVDSEEKVSETHACKTPTPSIFIPSIKKIVKYAEL